MPCPFQVSYGYTVANNMNEQTTPANPLDHFDHVVVLMLENRSFDNLLGYLYKPDDIKPDFPLGKEFAGLHFNGLHGNPVPEDAEGEDGDGGITLYTRRARDYFQPFPDPGEFYAHVNTQLYGKFLPPSNDGQTDKKIAAPYNLPDPLPPTPPMNGFIADYISVLRGLEKPGCLNSIFNFLRLNPKWFKLNARYDDYKAIMECYEPDQVSVMATLAKEFAVFDHWHCDVPSQTYTNRAFWHSGTAFGFVNNSPLSKWIEHDKDQPERYNNSTLFNRLQEKDISWNIYSDNPISLTAIVHFQALKDYHETNFKSFNQFLTDAKNGKLPAYSFVEPRFFTPNNDQHPTSYDSVVYRESAIGSVLLGEELIREVYNAVKNSHSDTGNNWKNTLLIITHDEHGGCFDHVPPRNACPPDEPPVPGEEGFLFDRLGIRVPMIMVSAHIQRNTIVNTPHRHTSFLRTMCNKWGLSPFTERDKTAPEFTEVFTSPTLRDISDWPDLSKPVISELWKEPDYSDAPLNDLQKAMIAAVAHWKEGSTARAETINTAKEAMDYLDSFGDALPGANKTELRYRP